MVQFRHIELLAVCLFFLMTGQVTFGQASNSCNGILLNTRVFVAGHQSSDTIIIDDILKAGKLSWIMATNRAGKVIA